MSFEQEYSSNPLVLTTESFVPELTLIKILVGSDADIHLPPEGVQLNSNFGFASTASNGPLPIDPPTWFDYVAPIGSFLETCEETLPCFAMPLKAD